MLKRISVAKKQSNQNRSSNGGFSEI